MILQAIGTLILGTLLGYLAQRSRMCFVGGFRDLLLVGDYDLLNGMVTFFAAAWLTIQVLRGIGVIVPVIGQRLNVSVGPYPSLATAIVTRFGLTSLAGGLGLGLLSTLAGGCPLRQHVMAGQGRKDSRVYLLGFYLGIVLYYLVTAKMTSGWR